MAGAGAAGACAASALPDSGNLPEIAGVLLVGALALLAGHAWGLMVVIVADVVLLGRVWPLLLATWPPSPAIQVATLAALAGALPGLLLIRRVLPGLVDELLGPGSSPSLRAAGVQVGSALAVAWLILPGL